jgi:hypothetical protein
MSNLSYLEVRYSGGASNTSQASSLGGAMSTVAGGLVKSQTATGITTLTGVTIDNAAGNPEGDGTLRFDYATSMLYWTPPNGSEGLGVDVSAGGQFAVQGASEGGYLTVTVVTGSLPGANTSNTITIANIDNNVFDDVSKDESYDGDVEYRCLYLYNAHGTDTMKDVKLWIAQNTPGQDVIGIALDAVGKNSAPSIIADEGTAPTGAAFDSANPASEATALQVGDLAAGEFYPFWIRRTVPEKTTQAQVNDDFQLGMSAYI